MLEQTESEVFDQSASQRAFITDLRLSPAQRKKSHYGPDYHTLGRGLVGKQMSPTETFTSYPSLSTYRSSFEVQRAMDARLPPIIQKTMKKAVSTIGHATNQSGIYDQLPPRGAHLTRDLPPPVLSHEKSPSISYKRMVSIRTNKHYHTM